MATTKQILILLYGFTSVLSVLSTILKNPLPQTRNSVSGKYLSKLLDGARPTDNSKIRRLEDVEGALSGYEVKFEKCQFVKAYSDELAQDEDHDSVLALQRFVVFRLCPKGTCENCVYDYGEYIIDMESYLEATVGYFEDWQENMCDQCDEACANDDANGRRLDVNVDCNECVTYCEKVEGMEENGFLEATNYAECQQIYETDDGSALYAGGMCSSNGEKIKIGVFSDEYCSVFLQDLDVDDYLGGYKLSHATLKKIYDKDSCVACTELNWDVADDDAKKNDDGNAEVTDMCLQLYEEAGKCESRFGFDNYWKDYEDYVNQYKQEDLVCNFVTSIMNGNYDQEGEISLTGSYAVANSKVTLGQVFFLVVYILGTIGFGAYSVKLYKLVKKGKTALLSAQGDGTLA